MFLRLNSGKKERWPDVSDMSNAWRGRTGHTHRPQGGTPMIQKLTKTLGLAVAVLCVVSTLAVAGEMTCTKADDKGCIMAKGADGKEMAVIGAGMKMGDKM